jgi:hypothetical protein
MFENICISHWNMILMITIPCITADVLSTYNFC